MNRGLFATSDTMTRCALAAIHLHNSEGVHQALAPDIRASSSRTAAQRSTSSALVLAASAIRSGRDEENSTTPAVLAATASASSKPAIFDRSPHAIPVRCLQRAAAAGSAAR